MVIHDKVDAWAADDDITKTIGPHLDPVGSAPGDHPIAAVVDPELVTARTTMQAVAVLGVPAAEVAAAEIMQKVPAAPSDDYVMAATPQQVVRPAATSQPVAADSSHNEVSLTRPDEHVVTATPGQRIPAGEAKHPVITLTTGDQVALRCPPQCVVPRVSADHRSGHRYGSGDHERTAQQSSHQRTQHEATPFDQPAGSPAPTTMKPVQCTRTLKRS
jgi:hypothetical protein